MNHPMTELNKTQSKEDSTDAGDPSSGDCCSAHPSSAETHAWTEPPPDNSLPGIVPYLHQHTMQPEMLDPLSLRFYTQCQPACPDYLQELQPSNYYLLTGPVPGPSDSSHHSSVSASWFTHEPVLCSMMPQDLSSPEAYHQQSQEGLTEATSHITQPVLWNQDQPGSVFFNMEPASPHKDGGLSQGKGESVLGIPSQFPQNLPPACLLHKSSYQTANIQPQLPLARIAGTLSESRSIKPCHCSRSQCLKLYCTCFAKGVMCSNCDCTNCHNNAEYHLTRHEAIKSCLGRNPDAFKHNKSCNCKRSSCLKNYCECYEVHSKCTSSCRCVGCKNYDDSPEENRVNVKDILPGSVITHAVVESVCDCLVFQAMKAEMTSQSPAQAEQLVLEEFGYCLSEIVKAMSSTK